VVQDDQENPKPAQPRSPMVSHEEGFVISAGTRDTVVVHPEDAPGLQPLPDWKNSSGCCGPAGYEGLNRACACGAPVATLAADCYVKATLAEVATALAALTGEPHPLALPDGDCTNI
jgi:hypothetical protein